MTSLRSSGTNVDFLLDDGNELARPFRWSENRAGFFCPLSKPIDFDLIEATFLLPPTVRLARSEGSIECAVVKKEVK